MAITLQPSPRQPDPTDTQKRTATDLATFLTTNRSIWYILPPDTLADLMGDTPHTSQSITQAVAAGLPPRHDFKTFYAHNDNGPWEVSYR